MELSKSWANLQRAAFAEPRQQSIKSSCMPGASQPAEEIPELLDHFGKRSGGEGEKKGEKHHPCHQFSSAIERGFVIQRGRVPESEEDDESKEKHPSGVVEDGDEDHDGERDEKDRAALPPEKGVEDVPSIQLAHGQEVKGRHKKTYPSGKPDGMNKNIVTLGNLTDHQALDEGKKEGVCQPDRLPLYLRQRDHVREFQADGDRRDTEAETH